MNKFWTELKEFNKELLSDGYKYTKNFYYKGDIKISFAARYVSNKDSVIKDLKTIDDFRNALKELS